MSRGVGARQRMMLKTMEAAMRYEWHHGALATPLCRGQIDHLFVRPFQSRISPQLFGNEAPTRAISDNPVLSEMEHETQFRIFFILSVYLRTHWDGSLYLGVISAPLHFGAMS